MRAHSTRPIPLVLPVLVCLAASVPDLALPCGTWELVGRQESTRFVSGAAFGGQVFGGTHCGGRSEIYAYPPFRQQQFFGGESVLDIAEFGGRLFSTHENGSRVYRLNEAGTGWDEVYHYGEEWPYMFFMAVFQGQLYLTGGSGLGVGLVRTADGVNFSQVAGFSNWVWLPVEFQSQLYLLGHLGTAYESGALGFRSPDGVNFDNVPALADGPEYQCTKVWGSHLYLGAGGWTNCRTCDDTARLYRFDGTTRQLVFAPAKNGITSIESMGGYLYALADSGWERDGGDSQLYRSADGANWEWAHTFPDPEMRKLVRLDDRTLLALGGKACSWGSVYQYTECCTPECNGRACGPDGCGGSCGPCGPDQSCDGAGQCVCPASTAICGRSCCAAGQPCLGTACCQPQCDGRQCGADGCGGSCGVCADAGATCSDTGQCIPASCTPDCTGRACGPDPLCSQSCGDCGLGEHCGGDGVCQPDACTPDCTGRACGPDPLCSQSCGDCGLGEHCDGAGVCQPDSCTPDCTGLSCGPDPVCSQSCGTCPTGETCDATGQCVPGACTPDCGGRECGPDPVCSESCGTCPGGTSCAVNGTCTESGLPDVLGGCSCGGGDPPLAALAGLLLVGLGLCSRRMPRRNRQGPMRGAR